MKNLYSKLFIILASLLIVLGSIACNEEDSLLLSDSNTTTDKEALEKMVDADESIQSFELNYNEEETMDYVLGKTSSEIFPIKVGQRMNLIERNLNVIFEGDTAYGTLVKTFEGVLFIVASSDSLNGPIDSLDFDVYEKQFMTTITRQVIFVKVNNTDNPLDNWKINAISLPVGGTLTENIAIESVSVYLPNGDVLTIDSPLEYLLSRGPSLRRMLPTIAKYEAVGVEVNIKSIYEDDDYVTLTHGAIKDVKVRAKKRFTLDESSVTYDGRFYHRTYKGEWVVNQYRGYKHAVINIIPWGVIKDSEAPVESNSWGIPYLVN